MRIDNIKEAWFALFDAFYHFVAQGGWVVLCLMVVSTICFLLLIEKVLFLHFSFNQYRADWKEEWQKRENKHVTVSLAMRERFLFEAESLVMKHLSTVKTCIIVFPMLGLLGTVTGMISVFDTLAQSSQQSNGVLDIDLISSGIAKATLSTMIGILLGILSLVMHSRVIRHCERQLLRVANDLRVE